jgi:hypothetical protein
VPNVTGNYHGFVSQKRSPRDGFPSQESSHGDGFVSQESSHGDGFVSQIIVAWNALGVATKKDRLAMGSFRRKRSLEVLRESRPALERIGPGVRGADAASLQSVSNFAPL